jgi:hypothetical protein
MFLKKMILGDKHKRSSLDGNLPLSLAHNRL